jgi:signal transduction histidine kinase
LLIFSCHQERKSNDLKNSADSLVSSFSWTNVPAGASDTTAVYLSKLLNKGVNDASVIKIYSDLCYYHFTIKHDLPKGLLYTDSMLMAVENAGPEHFSKQFALGYYSKGDILFALGRYDEAYKNYYAAKKIMDASKDRCSNGDYSYRIGMVLYKQGRFAEAGQFFRAGFEETLQCPQNYDVIYREQESLNNVALCYSKLNKTDSSLVFYQKALNFIDQHDTIQTKKIAFEVARGVVYGNMGTEYLKKGNVKKGEELFLKSIAINSRPGYENNDAALTQIKLARLYLSNNQLAKTGEQVANLKENLIKLNNAQITTSYHQLQAFYLNKLGKPGPAFDHLTKYIEMQDASQNRYDIVRETNIYERFQNLESQNEIDYLKKEKQLQQTYLYISVVFAIMSIVIILLIYFYWKKSKKTVKILTELNGKISAQKQQLEEAFADLENSDKEKDSLLRAVAHDLRNPIGGISSLVGLMIEDDTDEAVKQQHQLIKETCLNALSLINELIEAAENHVSVDVVNHRQAVDLVKLTSDAIELLKFKAQEKQQKISFESSDPEIMLPINREKILRVISNLISNAIKFSHEDTVIEVSIVKDAGRIKVGVKDSGIGIPLSLQPNVFQMFTAAKRSGTNGEKSYGLGLSISKKIINEHHGKIWFQTNLGGGTCFYFDLPLPKAGK